MTKREKFLVTLKKVLDYSLNTNSVLLSTLVTFIIVFGIIFFIFSKQVPIPLTEKEIQYYTTQAEIGYLKGLFYLDDNIKFIPVDDTTYNVYSSLRPEENQKLRVTFSNGTISKTELYYSVSFIYERIAATVLGLGMGFIVWLLFIFSMEALNKLLKNMITY